METWAYIAVGTAVLGAGVWLVREAWLWDHATNCTDPDCTTCGPYDPEEW